jgi:signal transduction histidine kinase
MSVSLPSNSSEQRGHPFEPGGWVISRGPAARLLNARDGREAVTAAVDLCRGEVGPPTVGILLEGQQPWLVSRGVPPAVRASMVRIATSVAATAESLSAAQIGTRVAEVMKPMSARVIAAGRAALVVGISHSDADERLLARVAAAVRDATQTIPFGRHADEPDVRDGLAWTAHELQAPLGAVRAVLDRLVDSRSLRPKDSVLLRGARDEVVRLLEVVDPLLRFATGEVDEPTDVVDLVPIVRDVMEAESLGEVLGEGDRHLMLQAPEALPVRADGSLITVALRNLVRNALAYSGGDAPVGVSLFRLRGRAVAQVWDRGPGVPSEERERVFRRSVRGRSVGTAPGHGLGLFIARRIAEMHGGTVSLGDSPRGADFRLELPLIDGKRRKRSDEQARSPRSYPAAEVAS